MSWLPSPMTEGIDIIFFFILSIIPVAQYFLDLLLQVTVSLPVLMTLHLIVDLDPCRLNLELMDHNYALSGRKCFSWSILVRRKRGRQSCSKGKRGGKRTCLSIWSVVVSDPPLTAIKTPMKPSLWPSHRLYRLVQSDRPLAGTPWCMGRARNELLLMVEEGACLTAVTGRAMSRGQETVESRVWKNPAGGALRNARCVNCSGIPQNVPRSARKTPTRWTATAACMGCRRPKEQQQQEEWQKGAGQPRSARNRPARSGISDGEHARYMDTILHIHHIRVKVIAYQPI